ncbi:DUF975 family protein [Bacteroidota bacterium]
MTENKVLMEQAREALRGRWAMAIGTYLIYMLLIIGIQSIRGLGSIASLIISGPMSVGVAIFSLSIARKQDAFFEQIFRGFKKFENSLVAYLIIILFVILWSLLLIVPGIIYAISVSLTFYIIAEDDKIKPKEAIDKSRQMMDGYKAKFFYLCLRFFLWSLLCMLTLGIGFLWLIPWMNVTFAKFYDDIKDQQAVI